MTVKYEEQQKGRHSGSIDFQARSHRSSGFISHVDITIYLSAERQRPELRGISGGDEAHENDLGR